MRFPRITTFADPEVIAGASGVVHDAAWVVETTLVDRTPVWILDGTVAALIQYGRALGQLSSFARGHRAIAIVPADGVTPPWVTEWAPSAVVPIGAPGSGTLTEVCLDSHVSHSATIVIAAPVVGLATTAALRTLQRVLPQSHPVIAIASALEDGSRDVLAAMNGGVIYLSSDSKHDATLELAIAARDGVDVVVHAECNPRAKPIVVAREPLGDVDRLRVDAVARDIDLPVFTASAVVHTSLLWPIEGLHQARRATAKPPTEAQLEGLELRPFARIPRLTPLPPADYRDRDATGSIVFDLGDGVVERRPIAAVNIATKSTAIDVEIIGGCVCVTGRGGLVRFRGPKLQFRMITSYLTPANCPAGVGIVNRGVMIEVKPGEAIALGEIAITFELASSKTTDVPETIVEGTTRRSPCRLVIDDAPIELVVRGDRYELRHAGRRLIVVGTIRGETSLDLADLWWLEEMTRDREVTGRAGVPIPIDVLVVRGSAFGSVNRHMRGKVVFDLVAGTIAVDATVEVSVDD